MHFDVIRAVSGTACHLFSLEFLKGTISQTAGGWKAISCYSTLREAITLIPDQVKSLHKT